MTDLERFRDHARQMSTAEHKPECPWSRPKECEPKPIWRGGITSLQWLGMTEPPPLCAGCVTDADRLLWARLAAEADAYLDREPEETLL